MKFKVNKDDINSCLQSLQSVVSSRNTLPVLGNVCFKAGNGQLELTATDMDLTVRTIIAADVAEAGATTLPAKRIFSIFRELPAEEISVTVDADDIASISADASFFRVNGLPEADYPRLPVLADARVFPFEQGTFRDMLEHVSYAASTDAARQILNGVLLSFKDGKLSVVATDSRRLALTDHELEFPADSEMEVIVPLKTVNELQRTLGDAGELKIMVGEKQIAFEFGSVLIISKRVEGNYPNFRQVIPQSSEERATMDREYFLNAIRRASLMSTDTANAVKLSFSDNKLEISAASSEVGEARETLAVKYTGKPIDISFNPAFLLDPLKVLVSDEVFLDLIDETSPGVIRSTISFVYVLMPIRHS